MKAIRKHKLKILLVLVSVLTVVAVSFCYPEHAETVARALMLLIAGV